MVSSGVSQHLCESKVVVTAMQVTLGARGVGGGWIVHTTGIQIQRKCTLGSYETILANKTITAGVYG